MWRRVVDDYDIGDSAGQHLLETALQAFDRMRQAQALIEKHGLLIADKWGQLKANPAATIERDSRSAMLQSFKALCLDLEPIKGIGRPPGVA